MCWNKGRLCWKIAKLFYFCHLKKLVRPETSGPYHVSQSLRDDGLISTVYSVHWTAVGFFSFQSEHDLGDSKTQGWPKAAIGRHIIPHEWKTTEIICIVTRGTDEARGKDRMSDVMWHAVGGIPSFVGDFSLTSVHLRVCFITITKPSIKF